MSKKLIRTCIGCREKNDKGKLIRIVRNKNGEIKVDFEQRLEGRGAYICSNKECFEKVIKKNRLKVALKTNISNSEYEEIRGVIFDKFE